MNTHSHNPSVILADPDSRTNAPPVMPSHDAMRYGRRVVVLGEEGDAGVMAEGHDRATLAAISAHGRRSFGPGWAPDRWPISPDRWIHRPVDTDRLWALFRTTCGCTDDQHAHHLAAPGVDACPCPHPGLPPCDDRFGWLADPVTADTPGAVAVTQVTR